jgi:hypothetical protein
VSDERKVVVYVRVSAVDLANVALWMKRNNIYRMAKPGGVVAKAVKYLAMLLEGQGISPGLHTDEEAEIAFGSLCFPELQFRVRKPSGVEVQAAGLVALGKLHASEGLLERVQHQQYGEYREDVPTAELSDAELNARQAQRDAEQREAFDAQMADIVRQSVLAGSTTLTRERYNEKYPGSAISEEELAQAEQERAAQAAREAEDAPRRREEMIAREEALIEREKEEKRRRKERLAQAAIKEAEG